MKTKTLEDILFQVYELGVQQTDCDLTKKANTIMMLANQRVVKMKNKEQLLNKENWVQYLNIADEGCLTNNAKANDIVSKITNTIMMLINQRVIEELNSIASFCQGATEEMIYEAVTKRIQELKQD